MAGQGRLGDKAQGNSDAHGCPTCPHPTIGPAILGSTNVMVNGRPALRVQDLGIHAACCGANMWTAVQGSATVNINGKAAFRQNDMSRHCGGVGRLVEGSTNVFVGDAGGGGAGSGNGAGGAQAAGGGAGRGANGAAAGGASAVDPGGNGRHDGAGARGARGGPRAKRPQPAAALSLGRPRIVPIIDSLAVPANVHAGRMATLRVARWLFPVGIEDRSLPEVSWSIDDRPCGTGTTISLILGMEFLGKVVRVRATAGASSEEAKIAVPELILEGPRKVDVRKEIEISARVQPDVAGTFVWFDPSGKELGRGQWLTFKGQVKSDKPGDQPVECRFTSSETGNVYTQKHPITVEDKPSLILPINLTIKTLDETTRWLATNPIEVRIDDVVVASHVMVERAGRVVVSFRIEPGDHELVITSGPPAPPPGRPRVRIVHFSSRVKITEDRTALAETGKRTDGEAPTAGDPSVKLGRGFSPKLPLRVITPKDPKGPPKK